MADLQPQDSCLPDNVLCMQWQHSWWCWIPQVSWRGQDHHDTVYCIRFSDSVHLASGYLQYNLRPGDLDFKLISWVHHWCQHRDDAWRCVTSRPWSITLLDSVGCGSNSTLFVEMPSIPWLSPQNVSAAEYSIVQFLPWRSTSSSCQVSFQADTAYHERRDVNFQAHETAY